MSQPSSKLQVQNISCLLPQSPSLGGLYFGNIHGAQNPPILQQYGIRGVLTLLSTQTVITFKPQTVPYHLTIHAHDHDSYQLQQHLQQCIDFIENARKITNVFVHCYAGVSRSVTICIAYLMWKFMWRLDLTMKFVKGKRIVAKPNQGFMKQLAAFQKKLFGQEQMVSKSVLNFNTYPFLQKDHLISTASQLRIHNKRGSLDTHHTNNRLYSEIPINNHNLSQRHQPPTPFEPQLTSKDFPIHNTDFNNTSNSIYFKKATSRTANNGSNVSNRSYNLNLGKSPNMNKNVSINSNSSDRYVRLGGQSRVLLDNNKNNSLSNSGAHFYNHDSIPIPKILNKSNLKKQFNTTSSLLQRQDMVVDNSRDRIHNTWSQVKINKQQSIEERKAKSRLVRPKDLPGYRT